ncbi:MAG: porphobilinogen synthase [Flavobacteriaceae bacterium]|nr:porphobilinogen synthase [Flavobacteriaceae bacterium]|tara:strand:- start:4851 stop:5831 length:981 start_codon:yes stop_codon:yes gene_type:complete
MYPLNRNRRLRSSTAIRALVRETQLSNNDFIVPLFIVEGKDIKKEIISMPDYFQLSINNAEKEVKELWDIGIKAVLLFVKVEDNLKDNKGSEALNKNGLMQRAIKSIKNIVPEMLVMTDVALDPYSSYGHDGIVENSKILNDPTLDVLSKMSISHAYAGADFVAPSDMMDGRVLKIRQALEKEGFIDTGIMSYGVKYSSSLYGPFRDALDSSPGFGDKNTYQMDFANSNEALNEVNKDIEEGADIIMVKPGLPYIDILNSLSKKFDIPFAVYQVSGEYSMLKSAVSKGFLDYDKIVLEQLFSFKRAGASMIATYHAKEAVKLLNKI